MNRKQLSIQEKYNALIPRLYKEQQLDVSHLGKWSLSSSKTAQDASYLLDQSAESYWQTDGDLPHHTEVQFSKLVSVSWIAIFKHAQCDDSYTPAAVKVEAGLGRSKLHFVGTYHIRGEDGWVYMKLYADGDGKPQPLRCMFLRITILQNLQHGRDSHVRGLRVISENVTRESRTFTRL